MEDQFASPVIAVDGGAAKRGAARESTFLQADLIAEGIAPLRGLRVRNLAAGGLMVETAQPLACGEPVTVVLRNVGEVAGRVAWTGRGRIGVAFDHAIDPREVRKAPPPASGPNLMLVKANPQQSRRPGLKIA